MIKNSDQKAIFLVMATQDFLDVPAEKSLFHVFLPDFVEWEKMTKQLHIITIAVILPKEAVYLG